MTDIPNNPATALEQIFWRIRRSGQSSVKNVWTTVLNAHPGTPEFAIRHAEVVHLVRRLQLYLLALPEGDTTRSRNEGDIVLWYSAVVHTGNWDSNTSASHTLIAEDKVKLLGSLGEYLSLRTSVENKDDVANIETLKSALADWSSLLEEIVLPVDLAAKIRSQVRADRVPSF